MATTSGRLTYASQADRAGVIRRCSCGRHAPKHKTCESCARRRRLSRDGKGAVALDDAVKARVLAVLRQEGEPLNPRVRRAAERSFGIPLTDVRVHHDGEAARTAHLLSASAYTVGHHIVFADRRYAPYTKAGLQLLAHELTHVVQQQGQGDGAPRDLVVGPEDDALERQARDVAAAVGTGRTMTVAPGSMRSEAGRMTVQRDGKVCGPDVTDQLPKIWNKIERNFWSWSEDKQSDACDRLIQPYVKGKKGYEKNIDAFDTLPLYYVKGRDWLLRTEMLAVPCGVPAPFYDENNKLTQAQAERRDLCSSSVVVSGKCWLSGTVNYGTYGIMMSACNRKYPTPPVPFPLSVFDMPTPGFTMAYGEALIRAYKANGDTQSEYDINEPISWYKAVYARGAAASPAGPGNRPDCDASGSQCTVKGDVVNWDYVWEPVKSRKTALNPVLDVAKLPGKPTPAPSPSVSGGIDWAIGWWAVSDGNAYYYYFFGDDDVIYIKQRPNTKWVPSKNVGRRGKVRPLEHGLEITWPPFTDEEANVETFTRMNWSSTTQMFGESTKYPPLGAGKM